MLFHWLMLTNWKCKWMELISFQQSKILGEEIWTYNGKQKEQLDQNMMKTLIGKFKLIGLLVQLPVEVEHKQNNKNVPHQSLVESLVLDLKFYLDHVMIHLVLMSLKFQLERKLILLLWELLNCLTHHGDMKDV